MPTSVQALEQLKVVNGIAFRHFALAQQRLLHVWPTMGRDWALVERDLHNEVMAGQQVVMAPMAMGLGGGQAEGNKHQKLGDQLWLGLAAADWGHFAKNLLALTGLIWTKICGAIEWRAMDGRMLGQFATLFGPFKYSAKARPIAPAFCALPFKIVSAAPPKTSAGAVSQE